MAPQPQAQVAGSVAPYGVPVAQMSPQPTFYTANGMVVQPMMTPTGQMVFVTEDGLFMVPSDAAMYSPPYGGADYGYGMEQVEPGQMASSYMAPMTGAPAFPTAYYQPNPYADGGAQPAVVPRQPTRPVTLKAPPAAARPPAP
jgi:hypothetical protein